MSGSVHWEPRKDTEGIVYEVKCVVHENDGGVMCKAWGDWICVHCLGRHVKILVSNSN